MLISYKSCDPVVCPNGKAGYKLPGQCCESCSELIYYRVATIETGLSRISSLSFKTTTLVSSWRLQPALLVSIPLLQFYSRRGASGVTGRSVADLAAEVANRESGNASVTVASPSIAREIE